MSNTKLHTQTGLISLVFGVSLILSACNHSLPIPPISQQPGLETPSTTPFSIVTPTFELTPSPIPQAKNWEFKDSCGAPVANVYPLANGFWGVSVKDHSPSNISWDFSQEALASQFHWLGLRRFELSDPYLNIAFLGTDQDQKYWIIFLSLNCSETIQLEVLLPVEMPSRAFLTTDWNEDQNRHEYWLIDGSKLNVYIAKDKIGQAIMTSLNVPNTALSIYPAGNINNDGRDEIYVNWWDRYDNSIFKQQNISLTQIYRYEYYGSYTLIGEVEPSWQRIDLKNDGITEFLKPDPSAPHEKWKIYAYQGVVYGWDGDITIPAPKSPVEVNPNQLPPLPNDLYFAREDKGWIWPKNGGQLRQVNLRSRVTTTVSPCSGMEIDINDLYQWSPGCRYKIIAKPGPYEGVYYVVLDRHSGKEIPIPNSGLYVRGYNTFTWGPQGEFLIYARADGNAGLNRIDLPSGKASTLVAFSQDEYYDPTRASYLFLLEDGSIVFMASGFNEDSYPPFGIYRLTPEGELRRLAALRPGTWQAGEIRIPYGEIFPAPQGSVFLFGERSEPGPIPNYQYMLIVDADGKTVLDATAILKNGQDFRWLP